PNPGLADQQRVVLAAASENLCNPFDFVLTPYQRIDSPLASLFVEVAGIGVQRIAGSRGIASLFVLHFRLAFGIAFAAGNLGNAMRDVVDYIYTRHALLLEQEDRLALLLAENGHQHVCPGDFTLARALHMEYRTLDRKSTRLNSSHVKI